MIGWRSAVIGDDDQQRQACSLGLQACHWYPLLIIVTYYCRPPANHRLPQTG